MPRARRRAVFVRNSNVRRACPFVCQFQLFPTMAHRWTIGSGKTIPAAVVYKVQDTVPPSATGAALSSEAPTLQLR